MVASQNRLGVNLGTAIESLRASGYRPGCCDMPEVEIYHRPQGFSGGYAACSSTGGQTSIGFLIELCNELGERYYPRRFEPVPTLACSEGQLPP